MSSNDLVQRKDDLQHDIERRKYQLKSALQEVRDSARGAAQIPARVIRQRPIAWVAGAIATGLALGLLRTLQRRRIVRKELKMQREPLGWRARLPKVLIVRTPEPEPTRSRLIGFRTPRSRGVIRSSRQ